MLTRANGDDIGHGVGRMPRKKPLKQLEVVRHLEDIPDFANEDQEDEFWSAHTLSDELWDAGDPLADQELPPTRPPTRTVPVELDDATIGQVKALARRLHKPYALVLRDLVGAALAQREGTGPSHR